MRSDAIRLNSMLVPGTRIKYTIVCFEALNNEIYGTDMPTTLSRNDYRTLVLASLGGALEFYDFIIFVFFAVVIGQLFFPPAVRFSGLSFSY